MIHLAKPGAILAERPDGGFGVHPNGDRRRRQTVRLSAAEVSKLETDGVVIARDDGAFVLTAAGASRVRRDGAQEGEAFFAQHRDVMDRAVVDEAGGIRVMRGFDPDVVMRRLAGLRNAAGRPWLEATELAAANRLRRDWALAEIGMVRGSDWTAAPMGSTPRGANNAQEVALARRCDARRRLADALTHLAPALRRVVERVCLHEDGLEALERAEGWPARSGKLALKLGLAQLAAQL